MAGPLLDGYHSTAMKEPKLLRAALWLIVFAFTLESNASLILWDGDTSTAWSDGANWSGETAPTNNTTTDRAGFVFPVLPTFQPNTGTRDVNGLVIGDGVTAVPSFAISGTDLTLGDGGIFKNAATSNTTISPDITLAADQTWTNDSASTLLVTGQIDNAGFNLTFDGSGFSHSTNKIEGSGNLTKTGTGTLLLEGTSTFTGTTFLSGGTVSISAVENLGRRGAGRILAFENGGVLETTATMSFNTRLFQLGTPDAEGIAGTFDVANGTTTQLKGAVSGAAGTGALHKTGGGILSLEATNSFTGGTIISAGTLRAGVGGNKATLGAESSSLTFNGTGATLQLEGRILDISRSFIFEQTGAIDTNGFDLILNGGTGGDGGLVKTGNGMLTINSTGSHSGGTTIRGGTMEVSAIGSISHTEGDMVVGDVAGDSGVLLVSGGSVENNWSILGNDIGSTGNANMTGGSWTTNGNFFVGYLGSGSLELSGGNLLVNIYQFHVGNEGDGTLQMSGGNLSTTNSYLGDEAGASGNATLTGGTWINSNNLVVGTDGSASLTISGNAVLEVGGTLSRGAGGAIELAAGGTLQIGRGGATGTLDTDLLNNGHLIFTRTTASTYSGSISGSGMLTKNGSGTLTLSETNSYSGATTINTGTLAVNGSIASSTATIANGGTLAGSGTVGNTIISSGGRIAPGNSPGILDTGDLTLEGGGGYNWEITSVSGTPGTDWDLIRSGGGAGNATITATPGSKFTIFVLGNPTGWNPATSYLLNIIDWGAVTGFDANAFAVDTTGFTGAPPIGVWSLANSGGFLQLGYFVGDPEWSGGSGNWSTGFFPPLTNGADITFTGTGGISTNNIVSLSVGVSF